MGPSFSEILGSNSKMFDFVLCYQRGVWLRVVLVSAEYLTIRYFGKISVKTKTKLQNQLSVINQGPRHGFDAEKKKIQKITWHCPFKNKLLPKTWNYNQPFKTRFLLYDISVCYISTVYNVQ